MGGAQEKVLHTKYMVRLTAEERKIRDATTEKLKGRSRKARRASVLLQVDLDGPGWADRQVADASPLTTQRLLA